MARMALVLLVATTTPLGPWFPASAGLAPAAASEHATIALRPPTSAGVLDPFRLSDGRYGPGNRGIEYATRSGERIWAAAAGTVAFVGFVAGNRFVSIDHADGFRTTYGFVGEASVRVGTRVRAGTVVARAAGPFHFSLRHHGSYLDPAPFFATPRRTVRLVPHGEREGHEIANAQRARADLAATLLDGPFGSRPQSDWQRRKALGSHTTRSPRRPVRAINRERRNSWLSSP